MTIQGARFRKAAGELLAEVLSRHPEGVALLQAYETGDLRFRMVYDEAARNLAVAVTHPGSRDGGRGGRLVAAIEAGPEDDWPMECVPLRSDA